MFTPQMTDIGYNVVARFFWIIN